MNLLTKLKSKKEDESVFKKQFICNGIDLADFCSVLRKDPSKNEFKYLCVESNNYTPSPIDNEVDDDFEGRYLGEIKISLKWENLKDTDFISYSNDEDLVNKVVSFIKENALSTIKVEKHSPIERIKLAAADELFSNLSRGGCTSIILSKDFKNNHSVDSDNSDGSLLDIPGLNNKEAIACWHNRSNESDIGAVLYVDESNNKFKIKMLNKYFVNLIDE